jgi:hypothetical protein
MQALNQRTEGAERPVPGSAQMSRKPASIAVYILRKFYLIPPLSFALPPKLLHGVVSKIADTCESEIL